MANNKTIYLHNQKKRMRKRKLKPRAIIALCILLAAIVGITGTLLPNVYQVRVGEEVIGNIASKEILPEAIATVTLELKTQYGADVEVADNTSIKKVRGKKSQVITPSYLATSLRSALDFKVEFKQVVVDGEVLGIIENEALLEQLETKLKRKYLRGHEGDVIFSKDVDLKPVFAKEEELMDLDDLYSACIKNNPETFTYEVKSGDTLWGIASKHEITVPRLLQANEGMTESTPLKIGQSLTIQRDMPVLKVVAAPEKVVVPEEVAVTE